jgi:50S ribosomal protein L16 3-hydroxylase
MKSNIPLGHLTEEDFLANYWQKKPVLIRQAFPEFASPIEPDELAGLAVQDGVLSRLILEQGGEHPWELRQGPLPEDTFDNLGDSHWTVLVQEVDRHVPDVADLFDRFTFLPNWRKDDVMVSFAAKNAGVGAHIDSYDVFLLQGSGTRRWEIGEAMTEREARYKEGLDIRILENFQMTETFELEPGDMLYLPPGVPHNGVAIEPCLTYSFGFLAPTRTEMVSDFGDWHEMKNGAIRYSDPDRMGGRNPGLISEHDINRVLRLLQQVPIERGALADWFGSFITRPQRGPVDLEEYEGTLDDFKADFADSGAWRRHEGVRVAGWIETEPKLFVDGQQVNANLNEELVHLISGSREISYDSVIAKSGLLDVLFDFTKRGWGYLLPGDDADGTL